VGSQRDQGVYVESGRICSYRFSRRKAKSSNRRSEAPVLLTGFNRPDVIAKMAEALEKSLFSAAIRGSGWSKVRVCDGHEIVSAEDAIGECGWLQKYLCGFQMLVNCRRSLAGIEAYCAISANDSEVEFFACPKRKKSHDLVRGCISQSLDAF